MVQAVLKTCEVHQLQLIDKVIDISVVAQRQIPLANEAENFQRFQRHIFNVSVTHHRFSQQVQAQLISSAARLPDILLA